METPNDLLKEVKEYFKYVPEVESESSEIFRKITQDELNSLNLPKEEIVNYNIESDLIVEKLAKDVFKILNEDELKRVKDNIAFGKVYNTTMNALCIKSNSNNSNYAIVINEGLLMLLHKYGKLTIASINPKCVTFCNRDNINNIDSKTYKKWADELIENYKKFDTPLGAMIKLDLNSNVQHSVLLDISELFVLCHELGHYFNGDLEKENNFINPINTNWEVYDENKDHQIEYKADLTGFDILCKVAKNKYNFERKFLIFPLASLFDIFALINPNSSQTHPSPIDRMCNIIKQNFGEKVMEDYLKTYSKELSVEDFIKSF